MVEKISAEGDSYRIASEPFYAPQADEIAVFEAAWRQSHSGFTQGANGLRQDPFHGTHGLAP